jgi:hypothetical protein
MYGSATAYQVFCLTFKMNVERAESAGGPGNKSGVGLGRWRDSQVFSVERLRERR